MSDNLTVEGRQERVALGISLMLGAYLLFSFIDVGAKWLALLGLPSTQLAFMRYAPHFLVSSAIIVRTHELSSLASSHTPMLLFRGSLLMGSTILNFFAVRYLPLTLTSTILFSAPLMVHKRCRK